MTKPIASFNLRTSREPNQKIDNNQARGGFDELEHASGEKIQLGRNSEKKVESKVRRGGAGVEAIAGKEGGRRKVR